MTTPDDYLILIKLTRSSETFVNRQFANNETYRKLVDDPELKKVYFYFRIKSQNIPIILYF